MYHFPGIALSSAPNVGDTIQWNGSLWVPVPASGTPQMLLFGAGSLQMTGEGTRWIWPGFSSQAAESTIRQMLVTENLSLTNIAAFHNVAGVGVGSYSYVLQKNGVDVGIGLLGIATTFVGSAQANGGPVAYVAGDAISVRVILEGDANPPATDVFVTLS